MDDERILMTMDDGEEIAFTVLADTVWEGAQYLLVTDAEDEEDGECYCMKCISPSDEEEEEAVYVSVTDDDELDILFSIFRRQLEGDIDITK